MTPKDFINTVFLIEYQDIVMRHAYISFALIAIGIEFLGACLDNDDFGKTGLSNKRFKVGIQLFPATYHPHANDLYSDLRSGFAHQFRPGMKFELTHLSEAPSKGWQHLQVTSDNRLCLVAEPFYEDFTEACKTV